MTWSEHQLRYWMGLAYHAAQRSHDPLTINGAVLISADGAVLRTGCNRFVAGIAETPERWQRPVKYDYVVHAEADVLLHGQPTIGSLLVCPFAACTECAKLILERGIATIVRHELPGYTRHNQWAASCAAADALLAEGGVDVITLTGAIFPPHDLSIVRDGQTYYP